LHLTLHLESSQIPLNAARRVHGSTALADRLRDSSRTKQAILRLLENSTTTTPTNTVIEYTLCGKHIITMGKRTDIAHIINDREQIVIH
jgi:hypothetical protein